MTQPIPERTDHISNEAQSTSALSGPNAPVYAVDLVFEGGAMHGIALVGALAVLEERGFQRMHMAGTSAGAIIAVLYAAGYTAVELYDLISYPFKNFLDRNIPIPGLNAPIGILTHLGLYKGDALEQQLREWLAAKGVRTFRDLRHDKFKNDPAAISHYKVQVIVSDITQKQLLVLPRDYAVLGYADGDEIDVASAVRMSASIPFFFDPVHVRNAQTSETHLLVDGGLLSNYPIWLFDSPTIPRWPTFGLRLMDQDPSVEGATMVGAMLQNDGNPNIVQYIESLIGTLVKAHDKMYIEAANFARTIAIPTLGTNGIDFNMPPEVVKALYQSGRDAATQFLASWDFQAYIAEFRSTKPHMSRREALTQRMRHTLRETAEGDHPEAAPTT